MSIGLADHGLGLREVGDVGAVGHRTATGGLDLGDDGVGRGLAVSLAGERDAEVVDDDRGALGGELERVGATDAAAGSGHDGDASGEDLVHGCSFG